MLIDPLSFVPEHPLLQEHISHYYFLTTGNEQYESKYFAFPHTCTVLNIHREANFEIKDYHTRVYADPSVPYNACVQGIRTRPLLAQLQGNLNKITILFKPLGLNEFGVANFGKLYRQPSMIFNTWDNSVYYQQFLKTFFAETDTGSKREMLENFLLQMYVPVEENQVVAKAISLLNRFEDNLSLEQVCADLAVHPRTLTRAFQRTLGVSPGAFRTVARFRNSLANKLVNTQLARFKDIAYQNNYYDQAYFNKVFRHLTGSNPQRFFEQVDRLADDKLIFEFLK